jgi:regulator of sirC expression with transglutaminase-like and TPR domain
MVPSESLDNEFKKYTQQPSHQWGLSEGALLIARQEYPELVPEKYLALIRTMAREAVELLAGVSTREEKLAEINRLFYGEWGFKGNEEDYYDPRNSYLSDVLERKTGIPIALSALYLELGWAAGLPLFGINFPGHFLVALKESETDFEKNLYIDPFNEGRILGRGELKALLEKNGGKGSRLEPVAHLRNAGVREILHRMLSNLKAIHAANDRMERALWAAEWMLLLKPQDWDSLRDKGIFCYSLGRMDEAEKALMEYLEKTKRPTDYSRVWQVIYAIRAQNPIGMN